MTATADTLMQQATETITAAFPKYSEQAIFSLLKKAWGTTDPSEVLDKLEESEALELVVKEVAARQGLAKSSGPASGNGGGQPTARSGGQSTAIHMQPTEFEQDPFAVPTAKDTYLRGALVGPSGSGKTYTGLAIMSNFVEYMGGGKIALIDTERGSAAKYRKYFTFLHNVMAPPYHPQKLIDLIQAAEKYGYPALMIDSLSHFWTGDGGILQIQEAATRVAAAGSGKYDTFGAGWREASPIHARMIDAILDFKGHVFVTMRTKTAYEVGKDKNGKTTVTKIGLAPIQRDGLEFEFDFVADMMDGEMSFSKTRFPALKDTLFRYAGKDVSNLLLPEFTDNE